MLLEEELPESLEELEKEIEELEKVEVAPPAEVVRKKERPEVPVRGFRALSVVLGVLILYIYLLVFGIIMVNALGVVDISIAIVVAFIFGIMFAPTFSNALLEKIAGVSLGGASLILDVISIMMKAYGKTFLANEYILLLILGVLPYLLAGVVAGAINRDPAYGFIAGFIVWFITFILGALFIYWLATFIAKIAEVSPPSLIEVIIAYVQTGYLSAVFLSIFGAMGGALRKAS